MMGSHRVLSDELRHYSDFCDRLSSCAFLLRPRALGGRAHFGLGTLARAELIKLRQMRAHDVHLLKVDFGSKLSIVARMRAICWIDTAL